jgi:hypothetical protein
MWHWWNDIWKENPKNNLIMGAKFCVTLDVKPVLCGDKPAALSLIYGQVVGKYIYISSDYRYDYP